MWREGERREGEKESGEQGVQRTRAEEGEERRPETGAESGAPINPDDVAMQMTPTTSGRRSPREVGVRRDERADDEDERGDEHAEEVRGEHAALHREERDAERLCVERDQTHT